MAFQELFSILFILLVKLRECVEIQWPIFFVEEQIGKVYKIDRIMGIIENFEGV